MSINHSLSDGHPDPYCFLPDVFAACGDEWAYSLIDISADFFDSATFPSVDPHPGYVVHIERVDLLLLLLHSHISAPWRCLGKDLNNRLIKYPIYLCCAPPCHNENTSVHLSSHAGRSAGGTASEVCGGVIEQTEILHLNINPNSHFNENLEIGFLFFRQRYVVES